MKLASIVESARLRLLGPMAPGPNVRVEGCEALGQQGAPVLKLYLWVEAPQSNPAVRQLRVELLEPHRDNAHLELRERRHEDVVVALPLETDGISPRLTVFAHLTQPLPGARGVLAGRVTAVGRPGTVTRWTPFRCIYRWDAKPAAELVEALIEPVPEAEAESPLAEARSDADEEAAPTEAADA